MRAYIRIICSSLDCPAHDARRAVPMIRYSRVNCVPEHVSVWQKTWHHRQNVTGEGMTPPNSTRISATSRVKRVGITVHPSISTPKRVLGNSGPTHRTISFGSSVEPCAALPASVETVTDALACRMGTVLEENPSNRYWVTSPLVGLGFLLIEGSLEYM